MRYSGILFILLLFSFVNCKRENKTSIIGNWYFFSYDANYNEVNITDSTFLYYSEIIEFYGPKKYSIHNDTIFFQKLREFDFESYYPRLSIIDDDKFLLEYRNDAIVYKRIINGGFTMDSIKKKDDIYKYYSSFRGRNILYLDENGYEVNFSSDFDTLFIKEEDIIPAR